MRSFCLLSEAISAGGTVPGGHLRVCSSGGQTQEKHCPSPGTDRESQTRSQCESSNSDCKSLQKFSIGEVCGAADTETDGKERLCRTHRSILAQTVVSCELYKELAKRNNYGRTGADLCPPTFGKRIAS